MAKILIYTLCFVFCACIESDDEEEEFIAKTYEEKNFGKYYKRFSKIP